MSLILLLNLDFFLRANGLHVIHDTQVILLDFVTVGHIDPSLSHGKMHRPFGPTSLAHTIVRNLACLARPCAFCILTCADMQGQSVRCILHKHGHTLTVVPSVFSNHSTSHA